MINVTNKAQLVMSIYPSVCLYIRELVRFYISCYKKCTFEEYFSLEVNFYSYLLLNNCVPEFYNIVIYTLQTHCRFRIVLPPTYLTTVFTLFAAGTANVCCLAFEV